MPLDAENSTIEMAVNGDISSFEKIVHSYEKMIYNICYRYFLNEEDAKDITQEVFIKIYRGLKKYNFGCKFSTWIYKIAVNSCIDQLRKRKSRPKEDELDKYVYQIEDSAQSPLGALISKENLENVEGVIKSLPEEYKSVIYLRDVEGYSYQEISFILDQNIGTVKSRISRGRDLIKKRLVNF